MRQNIVDAFPNAEVSIGIVWIDMLATDSGEEEALKATERFGNDPRIRFFYDPNRLTGTAFMKSIPELNAGGHIAWDIYMFFDREAVWTGAIPPQPQTYVHQLGGRNLPNLAFGENLVKELNQIMQKYFGKDKVS